MPAREVACGWPVTPEAAWARVRELHPPGPATEPGDAYFHHAVPLQALADLALDAGHLAAARDAFVHLVEDETAPFGRFEAQQLVATGAGARRR